MKIRAWDTENNKWVDHKDWLYNQKASIIVGSPSILSFKNGWVLEQWTGEVDADGNDIYLGDIVRCNGLFDRPVEFRDAKFYTNVPMCEWENLRIVGNIHES